MILLFAHANIQFYIYLYTQETRIFHPNFSIMKQLESKSFWRYLFPLWDTHRVESIIGVALHYLAILVFIPLSIFHNLHAIDHLQGLPYIWLFGLVCVIDLLIALLLGVAYEFFLSLRMVLTDSELKKAFEHSQSAKQFLLGSFKKSFIIIATILVVLISGTVLLSLKGGFNHAELATNAGYKPPQMTAKKEGLKSSYEQTLQHWTAYYDAQISSEQTAMTTHKKEVEYKGRVNIHNEATKKVVATHTHNIGLLQKAKAEKLAQLANDYQNSVSHLEAEHQEATQNYQRKLASNQSFSQTFVWAFSLFNIVFVLISLALNQESMEKGLHQLLAFRMREYYENRKLVQQEVQKIRKETTRIEKAELEGEAQLLKSQLDEKEELEEAKLTVEMLYEINEKLASQQVALTPQTQSELRAIMQKHYHPKGEITTMAHSQAEKDFFEVGENVELPIEDALRKLQTLGAEQEQNFEDEKSKATQLEISGFASEQTRKAKISADEKGVSVHSKKTIGQYEISHPLMTKYCHEIARLGFPRGAIKMVQEGMLQDENYRGESTSSSTISKILKLLKNDRDNTKYAVASSRGETTKI